MKRIKEKLYFLKICYQSIFRYPRRTIEPSSNYDAYWEVKTGEVMSTLSDWQKERAQIVLAHIKKEEGLTLGDIGCGDGAVLMYLKEELGAKRLIGYDTSPFILKRAAEIGVEVREINLNNDPLLSEVDYNTLFEVLEHLPNPEVVLLKAYKTALRGVFFSVPNSGYFTYRLRLLFGKFPAQWRVHPSEHLRFWALRDMHWWLNALGFKEYKVLTYKGVPILNRLFPSLFSEGLLIYLPKK